MNLKITQVAQAAESTHTHTHHTSTGIPTQNRKKCPGTIQQSGDKREPNTLTAGGKKRKRGGRRVDIDIAGSKGWQKAWRGLNEWIWQQNFTPHCVGRTHTSTHTHTHTHPFGQHTRTHTHPVAKYPCARQIMTVAGLRTTCHLPNSHIHCHLPLPITYLSTGLRATCF